MHVLNRLNRLLVAGVYRRATMPSPQNGRSCEECPSDGGRVTYSDYGCYIRYANLGYLHHMQDPPKQHHIPKATT